MLQLINLILKCIVFAIIAIIITVPLMIISVILWNSIYASLGEIIVHLVFTTDRLKSEGDYNNFKDDFNNLVTKYKL